MVSLLPAAAYLLLVSSWLLAAKRCPLWVHPSAAAVLLAVRIATAGAGVLLPFAVALGMAVVLIPALSRLMSPVGVLSVVTALSLLPFSSWWTVSVGLAAVFVVAIAQMLRRGGTARIWVLTYQTLAAIGVNPSGSLTKPDLAVMPTRQDAPPRRAMRLYLSPFLFAGVLLGMLLSVTS